MLRFLYHYVPNLAGSPHLGISIAEASVGSYNDIQVLFKFKYRYKYKGYDNKYKYIKNLSKLKTRYILMNNDALFADHCK